MSSSFIPRYLKQLFDVNGSMTPSNKDVFQYNSATSKWTSGGYSLDDLADAVITTPTVGQVLRHNGTNFVNAQLAHSDLSGMGTNTHAQIDTHIASTTNPHGAILNQSNLLVYGTFDISNTAPAITLTDTTASAKSLKIDVDADIAQIREKTGAANSLLSIDLINNRVGIGVSPSHLFHTAHTRTDTSGTVPSAIYGKTSANAPSSSSAIINGLVSELESLGTAINYTGQIQAGVMDYRHKGSGTVAFASGIMSILFNEGVGTITQGWSCYAEAENRSTGTITNAIAFFADIENSVGGSITNGICYSANPFNGSGTITTLYNFKGRVPQGVGAGPYGTVPTCYGLYFDGTAQSPATPVTNLYGIYLKGMTGGTNNYSIYSEAGLNYFGGKVGVFTTPSADMFPLTIGGTYSSSGSIGGISINPSVGGSGFFYGIALAPTITATKTYAWAVYGSIKADGAITVSNLIGLEYTIYPLNGATITTGIALNCQIGRWYSGTITTGILGSFAWAGSTASVANAISNYVQLPDFASTKNIGLYISTNASSSAPSGSYAIYMDSSSHNIYFASSLGMGVIPTAVLHLKAGTASANTAPLKLTAGTNLTTVENGAFEFDGTNLYFTTGGVRKTVTLV